MTSDETSLGGRSTVTVCCEINWTGRRPAQLGQGTDRSSETSPARSRSRTNLGRVVVSLIIVSGRRPDVASLQRMITAPWLPFATVRALPVIYRRETPWYASMTRRPIVATDLYIYTLDNVPPIYVVWNHVAVDKLTTANGGTFTSSSASFGSQSH